MNNLQQVENQILRVTSFHDLVSKPFYGNINAICWTRELNGDFSEIVNKVKLNENIMMLEEAQLAELQLSANGQLAREILLSDLRLLKALGASPVLNLIKHYDRDEDCPFFPTDVYSFHVDRSPIPTDTFLCTYHGAPSEILPNAAAEQKVLVPEIRAELKKIYRGEGAGFESFLTGHFFDLHYRPVAGAVPIGLGNGHWWRLAVDHPESKVLPCIHRAPVENDGQTRLLMIC